MMQSQGVAISLFSGAGGLDLGAERAGFQVRAAVEHDRDAALTMEKNFPGLASPVIQADILQTSTRDLLRAAGLSGRERPGTAHWWSPLHAVFQERLLARVEAPRS